MKMYLQTICAVLLLISTYRVTGQAEISNSYTADKQPLQDKALFLADALVRHPATFRKLLKIIDAGWPLLDIGIDDPRVNLMINYFLDRVPELFNASSGIGILNILTDELRRVSVTDVTDEFQKKNLSFTSPDARDKLLSTIWSRYDVMRTLRRVLSHRSVRDYLPLNPADNVSTVCYNDMMNFIDAIPGVQHAPREDLNYSTVHWAMQMLDSYGKPPSGILEGNLDWKGSVDECLKVHAHLDPGVIIGNKSLTAPVKFRGKYCQMKFSLQASVVSFLNKFQKNLDSFSWGMCFPDSCSNQDVMNIFQLGMLKNLNMVPTSVSCSDNANNTDKTYGDYVTSSAIFQHFNVCTGVNGTVNQYQWQHCIFSKFDVNNNGAISKDEWNVWDGRDTSARFFLQMDINHNLQIDSTDLVYLFKFFDNNGDGDIDGHEFTFNWKSLFWTNTSSTQDNTILPAFNFVFNGCDSDGRGLNKDKWLHCFFSRFDIRRQGLVSKGDWTIMESRESMARYFLMLDINKDAKLDHTDVIYLFGIFDDNGDGLITSQEFTWNCKSIMGY